MSISFEEFKKVNEPIYITELGILIEVIPEFSKLCKSIF